MPDSIRPFLCSAAKSHQWDQTLIVFRVTWTQWKPSGHCPVFAPHRSGTGAGFARTLWLCSLLLPLGKLWKRIPSWAVGGKGG